VEGGSELDDQKDKLGAVIKDARFAAKMTRMELAAILGISQRHLMYIENGNHKPSFDLLFQIIQALSIPADRIFHPEQFSDRQEIEQVIAMLRRCDEKYLGIISATLGAMLERDDL